MRLIIQSDDYGITEAVSLGILKGIRDGLVTSTGLFANMPFAGEAARMIRDFPQVCLGEDINLVAGRPCADPAAIPSLVQPDGSFKTSGMHRQEDAKDGGQGHVRFEDCLREIKAQIQRFIELTGRKPEYLHGHSYTSPEIRRAMEEAADQYKIRVVHRLVEQGKLTKLKSGWNKKPFFLEDQLKADPLSYIRGMKGLSGEGAGLLITHCGYVDAGLFDVSTYTLIRTRDLAAVTSLELKEWVREQGIELISYRDLGTEEGGAL